MAAGTYDVEVTPACASEPVVIEASVDRDNIQSYTIAATGLVGSEDLQPVVVNDECFVRGDANRDGEVNIADPFATLIELFSGAVPQLCLDAADIDDDSHVTLTDAVISLDFLFRSGPQPVAPFPDLGTDGTADELSCTLLP